MLRNPLASPDIIGISYGASAAAVTAIVVFGASGAAGLRGGARRRAGVAAIYAISRASPARRRRCAGNRLILAGVGIAAAAARGGQLPHDPRRHPYARRRPRVAQRLPQLRQLGARGMLVLAPWSCACRDRSAGPLAHPGTRRRRRGRAGHPRRAPPASRGDHRRRAGRGGDGGSRPGRVRRLPGRAHRAALHRKASLPASALVGALIVARRRSSRPTSPPACWTAPCCPSASSPARSVPRSCCGSWSRPTEGCLTWPMS